MGEEEGARQRLTRQEKQGVSEKKKKNEMTISLTVQPRIQREKWSLYWKESMMTKTDVLDPVVLKVDEKNTKVADVLQMLSTRMSWPEKQTLLRLGGLRAEWQRMHGGFHAHRLWNYQGQLHCNDSQ